MSEMKVRKLGITDIKMDAIVNAANEELVEQIGKTKETGV